MAGITATPQLLPALLTPVTSVTMGADIALTSANLVTPSIAAQLVSSSITRAPVLETVAIVASVKDAAVASTTPTETPVLQKPSSPAEMPHVAELHEDRVEIATDTTGALIWASEPSQTVPTILFPEAPALTSTRIDPFITGAQTAAITISVETQTYASKRTTHTERQTRPAASPTRRSGSMIDQRKAAIDVFRSPSAPPAIGGKKSEGTRLVSRYGLPPQTPAARLRLLRRAFTATEGGAIHTPLRHKSGSLTFPYVNKTPHPILQITSQSTQVIRRKHIDAGAHIIIETHFGTTSIREYFVDRGGELVFAGWESGKTSSENLATVTPPSWDAISAARPGIFSFGLPGGETAFKQEYVESGDLRLGAELMARVIAQLKGGPGSLENSLQLAIFNSFLRNNGARLTNEDWKTLVSEALRLAVRNVPVFDDAGARDTQATISDAASLLSIEKELFAAWEEYFDVDFARKQEDTVSTGIMGRLIATLAEHIDMLAEKRFTSPANDFTLGRETALQWEVVRITLSGNIENATDYLFTLAGKGERARACIALALIVKNSELNELGVREGAMIPRRSADEITALMKAVTESKYWDIASHRAFRERLTPNENAAVNLAISSAEEDPFDSLRAIDVTQVSEDAFWSAVEASGQADAITFKALLKMGLIAAQTHKGAATRGVYSHSNSTL